MYNVLCIIMSTFITNTANISLTLSAIKIYHIVSDPHNMIISFKIYIKVFTCDMCEDINRNSNKVSMYNKSTRC